MGFNPTNAVEAHRSDSNRKARSLATDTSGCPMNVEPPPGLDRLHIKHDIAGPKMGEQRAARRIDRGRVHVS